MQLFLEELRQGEDQPPLLLSLDARDNDEERESALISFYKEMREKSQWTAPFNCRILALIDSDLFRMAGRLIGHSAIHGGPTLSGLSLAVLDALIHGTKEMATSKLCLEDCPDVDHMETIGLLLKEEWGEEESLRVTILCLEWYFPVPTKETNRLLLIQ
ncbi:hypothetical protein DPEC_G00098450 [Dallia pectoralis]|uniref:Uncharacterized protein n=1 Tax=Dallia pectoralis TaxID=75939 RepID=A0ACC2GW60_DALPE|nr:hypothetical protein DPEC_G00098450 [Dallia pectoralis]